jgi:aryl-alcohol dehydrogenase-like predicted oxidoreductase
MKTVKLKGTNLEVSRLCLGTMTFGKHLKFFRSAMRFGRTCAVPSQSTTGNGPKAIGILRGE